MNRFIVSFALVILGATIFGFAGSTVFAAELPRLTGRVVDNAHVLKPGTIAKITAALAEHEKATSNQVVVVTVPSLDGLSIEDYGLALGRGWHIGQKDKNNGAILIVAPNERKMRIEVGYGLEGTLTDAVSHTIIAKVITPLFRKGNLDGGVAAGVDAILMTLTSPAAPAPAAHAEDPSGGTADTGTAAILGLFAFAAIALMIVMKQRRDKIRRAASIGNIRYADSGLLNTRHVQSAPARRSQAAMPAATAIVIAAETRERPRPRKRDDSDSSSSSSSGSDFGSGWGSDSGGGFSGGGGDFGGGGSSGSW